MSRQPVIGVIGTAAGGIQSLRTCLVHPLQARGCTVTVTLTPAAATWLEANGEIERLAADTGYPVRSAPRLPDDTSPHPTVSCYAVVPATANTVAKLALGIADNQALTSVCEAIGGRQIPVVVFPRINAAHAGQPAWNSHLTALRTAGVHLVYGEDVWPLHQPRSAPSDRDLPWDAVLQTIADAL